MNFVFVYIWQWFVSLVVVCKYPYLYVYMQLETSVWDMRSWGRFSWLISVPICIITRYRLLLRHRRNNQVWCFAGAFERDYPSIATFRLHHKRKHWTGLVSFYISLSSWCTCYKCYIHFKQCLSCINKIVIITYVRISQIISVFFLVTKLQVREVEPHFYYRNIYLYCILIIFHDSG